jgi:hypothetical protein
LVGRGRLDEVDVAVLLDKNVGVTPVMAITDSEEVELVAVAFESANELEGTELA